MPKARSAKQARKAIIDAALSLFAQHGFAAVSIRAVALTAGVSQGLIYHHFADKNALWAAASASSRDEVLAVVEQHPRYLAATCPWEQLQCLLLLAVEYIRSHPEIVRLRQWGALQNPSQHARTLPDAPTKLFRLIIELQASGRIRTDRKPELLSHYVTINTVS